MTGIAHSVFRLCAAAPAPSCWYDRPCCEVVTTPVSSLSRRERAEIQMSCLAIWNLTGVQQKFCVGKETAVVRSEFSMTMRKHLLLNVTCQADWARMRKRIYSCLSLLSWSSTPLPMNMDRTRVAPRTTKVSTETKIKRTFTRRLF